jgi:hypothetical protein
MKRMKEVVLSWLLPAVIARVDTFIEKHDEKLAKNFEGLQAAHRKLLERVMDLELREKHRLVPSSMGPPTMSELRPGFRSRSSRIREAQEILNDQLRKDAPEKADLKHA